MSKSIGRGDPFVIRTDYLAERDRLQSELDQLRQGCEEAKRHAEAWGELCASRGRDLDRLQVDIEHLLRVAEDFLNIDAVLTFRDPRRVHVRVSFKQALSDFRQQHPKEGKE